MEDYVKEPAATRPGSDARGR